MAKTQPDEQYTPRGTKIPIPTRKQFYADLDKVVKAPVPAPKKGVPSDQR